ncbi:hypothetical protein M3D91_010450 [Micrococcus luteus]|nr:hypothetical protein [Micrococcus luteus]
MAMDDESQIAEDFGMMVRMVTGASMQLRENQLRARAMQVQSVQRAGTEEARVRANAARVVQHDLYSRDFWRHAGSESIADRLAVAAALGSNELAARSAWMHGADVLRSEFGIDLQEINRAHPSSLEQRHAALRDALDDYFAQLRQDRADDRAVAEQVQEQEAAAEEPAQVQQPQPAEAGPELFVMHDLSNDRGDIRAVEKDGALRAIENAPDNLGRDMPEAWADVQGWIGRDQDVDRAIAEKFPDAMTDEQRARALGQEPESETYTDTAGVAARADEQDKQAEAQGDTQREEAEAEGDAARVEHLDDLAQAAQRDMAHLTGAEAAQLPEVRRVQLESFPHGPHVLNPSKLNRAPRKRPAAGIQAEAERAEVLSR